MKITTERRIILFFTSLIFGYLVYKAELLLFNNTNWVLIIMVFIGNWLVGEAFYISYNTSEEKSK